MAQVKIVDKAALMKSIENAGHLLEKFIHLHLYVFLMPGLIYIAEHPWLMTFTFAYGVVVSMQWISFYQRMNASYDLTALISERCLRKYVLWSLVLLNVVLRMWSLPSNLSDNARHFIVLPYLLFINFFLIISTIDNLLLTLFSQVCTFLICCFIAPLSWGEVLLVSYSSVILIIVTISAVGQTMKVRQLLEQQTLHMSSIHHEIKTPLQGIIGAADVIGEELSSCNISPSSSTNTLKEFLEVIRISSIYLTEIIEHMMRFSNQLNNPTEPHISKFRTASFIQELKVIASAYPRHAGVKLTFSIAQDLPEYIYAERTSLQQVLVNVISNALKFTEEGHVHLSISKNASHIVFRCSDTGCGMSEGFMSSRLFSPFSQENTSLNSKPRGLGLGLALSKQMLQQMKGELQVESRKDEGTIMTVLIPLVSPMYVHGPEEGASHQTPSLIQILKTRVSSATCESCDSTLSSNPLASTPTQTTTTNHTPVVQSPVSPPLSKHSELKCSDNAPSPTCSSPNITASAASYPSELHALVIDDNSINRQVLLRLLMKDGFQCVGASSGLEALEIVANNKNNIHVILLDMFMPGMDGKETSERISVLVKDWTFAPLIVGCSADSSQRIQRDFSEAGVSYFLNKPITLAAISGLKSIIFCHFSQNGNSPPPSSPLTLQPSPSSESRKRHRRGEDDQTDEHTQTKKTKFE